MKADPERHVATPSHCLRKNPTNDGPFKKSDKQSTTIQQKTSQQNIRSALWIFFLPETGNEKKKKVLILLYCYRTTLSEVLQ